MSTNIIYAVIIVLILIIIFSQISYGYTPELFLEHFCSQKIDYYDFDNTVMYFKSPKTVPAISSVCFIAGVHGNEPAGTEMLMDLLKSDYFDQQSMKCQVNIRVIPAVNKWGLEYGQRYQPDLAYPDINRNFQGEGLEPTSAKIIELTQNYDLVVDFHEGWGFHLINPTSVGSTVLPGRTPQSLTIANLAMNHINKNICDPRKKFIVMKNNSCEIPKTLSCYREQQKKHYVLVETSGQNDIQPLETRKSQVLSVIQMTFFYILHYYFKMGDPSHKIYRR